MVREVESELLRLSFKYLLEVSLLPTPNLQQRVTQVLDIQQVPNQVVDDYGGAPRLLHRLIAFHDTIIPELEGLLLVKILPTLSQTQQVGVQCFDGVVD